MSPSSLTHKSRRHLAVLDRRAAGRQIADGEALVVPADFSMQPISGQLVDASPQGFRITYEEPPLFSGQDVHFLLAQSEGQARVIWTRVMGSKVESGFLILGPDRRSK